MPWHHDRVAAWLNGERISPITMDCALTTHCNYRCVYCYGQLQRLNQGEHLSREVIFRFLDDAAEIGVKGISLVSDGESTCSPYLYEAVLRGKSNGLDMSLGTNGYLLKEARLPELLPALTYLRFNISAAEAGRYSEIHGCKPSCFDKVCQTIKQAVAIKQAGGLATTIGLQMVLLPEFQDQVVSLAVLGQSLGVDYLVIKHCSDDENGSLGVDYRKYRDLVGVLKQAEGYCQGDYLVGAKWSKILSGGRRTYKQCFGPPFLLQISGSGLVAPCGMFFNDKYRKYHIGNIRENSFREIWKSSRYWEVMDLIASPSFNAKTDCGTLCLQHKVNEYLWMVKHTGIVKVSGEESKPSHVNFI